MTAEWVNCFFAISEADKIGFQKVLLDVGRIEFGTFKLSLEDSYRQRKPYFRNGRGHEPKYHPEHCTILYSSKVTWEALLHQMR